MPTKTRSLWREFEFFYMIVQHAIVPRLQISRVIERWQMIKMKLMDNGRKRVPQLVKLGIIG